MLDDAVRFHFRTKMAKVEACAIKPFTVVIHTMKKAFVDKFKSNLLLMIFWLNIINYNS